ncbi:hypothetical protein M0208_13905 [Sphingomonas sp. SUN019]|uniref:hypothetical protein n=1 Tax=Sphingomonas sp. SUN019 TaxID=2937788 RepID=UPI0021644A05|nr:hypothetical protein [Sphingomonas sp. SUN019]UVO51542.1 hypothetical protein M0208_13905 [Sphingomonas sp. SUN019]
MTALLAAPHATERPALPTETFLPQDETPHFSSRRHDGWSAANQRLFLEAIAEGHGVDAASLRVGLSASSAYAFRRTAKGAAFALGWRAAGLVARDTIAETLLVRALEGQVDTLVRADGTTVTRHRHDNRLAMSLLARLDRQVETAADADVKAARLVAQEFDAFLDLVARDEGPARAGLFLARRSGGLDECADDARDLAPIYALAAADRLVRTGVATAQEVDVADLDPAARAHWTAEQWARAEAAGLVALACPADEPEPEETSPPETSLSKTSLSYQHSQHSPAETATDDIEDHIWWDYEAKEWRTDFPPTDDFDGDEHGDLGHVDYQRTLGEDEAAVMGAGPDHYDDEDLADLERARDAFFAQFAVPDDDRAEPAHPGSETPPSPALAQEAAGVPAGRTLASPS